MCSQCRISLASTDMTPGGIEGPQEVVVCADEQQADRESCSLLSTGHARSAHSCTVGVTAIVPTL